MRGMIVDGVFGKEVTKYTGSTTGTSRNNVICSAYTPITWQVDRKCHLISASSFDKMCADMKTQRDDMSGDLYPHGAREIVADYLRDVESEFLVQVSLRLTAHIFGPGVAGEPPGPPGTPPELLGVLEYKIEAPT